MAILRNAAEARQICLGAAGFWLDSDGHRPSREHILDLSAVSPRDPRTNASIALRAIEQWPDDPRRFAVELVLVSTGHPCPCCGYLTFDEPPGSYEICPVCFWEDDAVQLRWPTYEGGANRPSLIDSQRVYAADGAIERRFIRLVRTAQADEPLDASWRPIDVDVDSFEEPGIREADWPKDLTALYWWRPTFWRRDRS